jgi:hypothetical protein
MTMNNGRILKWLWPVLRDHSAVSRRLPTAAARVRAWSGHVGFVVDKVALGQVSSEYFGSHQILHPHNHPGQVQ